MALGHMPGEVGAQTLLRLLVLEDPAIRGAAALALAHHQPDVALQAVPAQLRLELQATMRLDEDYEHRGKPQLTQSEIDEIARYFRCQMKMVQAISTLGGKGPTQVLEPPRALRAWHASEAQYDVHKRNGWNFKKLRQSISLVRQLSPQCHFQ
jgi:hypothetical protein